jgi:glycosyltransferase involved in cell wall biosynthesis
MNGPWLAAGKDRSNMPAQPTIVIITQVYIPDPASVGQHMGSAAAELGDRDLRVVVLTSRTGYEDPTRKYPAHECHGSVTVCRLPWSSFGKDSMLRRLLGAASFLFQALLRTLFMPQVDGILVSTSPPMCSLAALVIAAVRRVPIVYWVMDINPDQAVALGHFHADSLPVRWMNRLNRAILRRAERIITLDHFMAQRLMRTQDCRARIAVIPPWPLERTVAPIAHRDNPFRRQHGLDGKFVVMYSGNMSTAHPLRTILDAAERLRDRHDLLFMFVGGGQGRKEVEQFLAEHDPGNIRLLPYQPLHQLRYSLSAADVHLVSMGDNMVGIVHPCKIYGAMACGRPVLLIGPRASHAGELLDRHEIGWQIDHGNVPATVKLIETLLATGTAQLAEIGLRAQAAIERALSKPALCAAFCDEIELALAHGQFFGAPPETGAEADGRANVRGKQKRWPASPSAAIQTPRRPVRPPS